MSAKKATKKTTRKKTAKRVYKGDVEVDHDLFKLDVAMMQKDTSYEGAAPNYLPVEHAHFFHSYSSKGKKQEYCSFTGGHAHKCKMSIDSSGDLVLEIGPAVVNRGGKWVPNMLRDENGNYSIKDNHTHKSSYIRSEKIKIRTVSSDQQQAVANAVKELEDHKANDPEKERKIAEFMGKPNDLSASL